MRGMPISPCAVTPATAPGHIWGNGGGGSEQSPTLPAICHAYGATPPSRGTTWPWAKGQWHHAPLFILTFFQNAMVDSDAFLVKEILAIKLGRGLACNDLASPLQNYFLRQFTIPSTDEKATMSLFSGQSVTTVLLHCCKHVPKLAQIYP